MSTPTHLAVGVVKKPHGIKGDVLVFPLTDAPELVFVKGRTLVLMDRQGVLTGHEVEVTVARAYHRAWLLHFKGHESREALEVLRERYLGQSVGEARALDDGEFYLHELNGMRVELKDKSPIGVIHSVYEAPQGYLLGVRSQAGKERLVPLNPEYVRRVDRGEKLVIITPPDGFLEL